MAKTSNLPLAGLLTGSEIMEIEQGGAKKRLPFSALGTGTGSAVWGSIGGSLTDQDDLVAYVATAAENGNIAFGWGNHAAAGYLTSLPVHNHDANDIVTGVLSTLRGGTGINSYIAGQLLYASSTSALSAVNPGTNGHVLTMVSGLPAWLAVGIDTSLDYTWTGLNKWTGSKAFGAPASYSNNPYMEIKPTLSMVTGNISVGLIAVDINPTFSGGNTPRYIGLRVNNGDLVVTNGNFTISRHIRIGTSSDILVGGDINSNTELGRQLTIGTGFGNTRIGRYSMGLNGGFGQYNTIIGSSSLGGASGSGNTVVGTHLGGGYTSSITDILMIGQGNTVDHLPIISGKMGTTGAIKISDSRLALNTLPTFNLKAILELDSTTKGFLISRMTTLQQNAIASPTTGLQLFDTNLNCLKLHNGTGWQHQLHAPNNTKITAAAPYSNDGYVEVNIGGTLFKIMTTA